MFVLFTFTKLTLDEHKTLTKISTCKPLTTVPQTSAHLRRQSNKEENLNEKANNSLQKRAVCTTVQKRKAQWTSKNNQNNDYPHNMIQILTSALYKHLHLDK